MIEWQHCCVTRTSAPGVSFSCPPIGRHVETGAGELILTNQRAGMLTKCELEIKWSIFVPWGSSVVMNCNSMFSISCQIWLLLLIINHGNITAILKINFSFRSKWFWIIRGVYFVPKLYNCPKARQACDENFYIFPQFPCCHFPLRIWKFASFVPFVGSIETSQKP